MGLWEFLRQWPRAQLIAGILASIMIHLAVVGAVLWAVKAERPQRPLTKRGDTIIVELSKPEEPANAGTPTAPSPPPPRPPAALAKPSPPAVAKPSPPATPAPRPEPPREARPVASAPRVSEPPPKISEPAAPIAEPASPRTPEADPRAANPAPPATADPAPRAPAPTERREPGEHQIAAVPPSGGRPVPSASDVRSALRSGAGGQGQGRGGIVGDPIPLDTPDPRFQEYFEQVKRRIQSKLIYPCLKNRQTFDCEYKTTSVVVHFGILKSGQLQFVESYLSSEWAIYDDYSMNAIRLAQPFPPVPPAIMAALRAGTTGIPIAGHFNFTVYTSLDSILR